jgi:protein phosphatase
VGRRRLSNEDSFLLCEAEGLCVVCDGMGGHESGEIASRLAVDTFADRVGRFRHLLDNPSLKLAQARSMAQELVVDWTQVANSAIHERGKDAPGDPKDTKSRMGTTLALAFFVTDFVVVANVGDSRVYRLRGEALERLSEDHVIVADAQRHPADPRPPRKRKFVTRALGTKASVEPQVRALDVRPGDLFVLCSDGLTDLVDDEDIVKLVRKDREDLRNAVRALIALANKRGGNDNVTVVLAEVVGAEGDADDTDELPIT